MKKIGKLLLLICCLLLIPGLGTRAAEKLQYLYIGAADGENPVSVVVSVEGDTVTNASITYEGGSAKAAKIKEQLLVFQIKKTDLSYEDLKTLTLTTDQGKEKINLQKFMSAYSTEMVGEEVQDSAGVSLSKGAEQQVESLTAADVSDLSAVLARATANAGTGTTDTTGNGSEDVIVVLDPGHGGWDGGASRTWDGKAYIEKNINLKISKYTKAELEKYAGVQVYLTRETDVYLSIEERVNFAAQKGATVLISQHINSTGNNQDTVSGAAAFVASGNYRPELKGQSWKLAQAIVDELATIGMKDVGLMVTYSQNNTLYPDNSLADYYGIVRRSVLAGFPGIIMEHGFVNNPSDCKKFYSTNTRIKKIGVRAARAIAKYYGLQLKTDVTEETPAAGWVQENGKYYYQKADGTRYTGWLTRNGKSYYLNAEGWRVTGWLTDGANTYYMDETTGTMRTGWQTIDGKLYYFHTDNGIMQKGMTTIGEDTYYFSTEDGSRQTGLQKLSSGVYYFHAKTGKLQKNRWLRLRSGRYYLTESGKAYTGVLKLNGDRYYFYEDGHMAKSKWVYYKKRWYFASKKGVFYKSITKKINGKRYTFNSKGICKTLVKKSFKKVPANAIIVS